MKPTGPTLFDEPPARARAADPTTSHAAAQRVDEFGAEHHARILAALRVDSGTIYDLEASTGIDHVAIARRMDELRKAGKARTTGDSREGPTGRKCRVWAVSFQSGSIA